MENIAAEQIVSRLRRQFHLESVCHSTWIPVLIPDDKLKTLALFCRQHHIPSHDLDKSISLKMPLNYSYYEVTDELGFLLEQTNDRLHNMFKMLGLYYIYLLRHKNGIDEAIYICSSLLRSKAFQMFDKSGHLYMNLVKNTLNDAYNVLSLVYSRTLPMSSEHMYSFGLFCGMALLRPLVSEEFIHAISCALDCDSCLNNPKVRMDSVMAVSSAKVSVLLKFLLKAAEL